MIFRLKVFVPVILIVLLIVAIMVWCLDGWARQRLERMISSITETQTNITELKISLLNSSVKIKKLEIASPDEEFKNLVEFEDIVIDVEALPLLRKQVVVNEFSVNGIQWGSKRKKSGRLIKLETSKPGALSKLKEGAIERIKGEFDNLPLSQFTDFRIPTDPREILERMEIKSPDAFKAMIIRSQEIQTRWTLKLRDVKDLRAADAQMQQARALLQNFPTDPEEILNRIEQAKSVAEFIKKEEQRLDSSIQEARADADRLEGEYKSALGVLESDFDKAKSMVSLSKLDLDNLSRLLFGSESLKQAEIILKAHSLLRHALSGSKKDGDIQALKRAKGRDIIFVTSQKEPGFVLEKSDFSIKGVDSTDRTRLAQLYELKLRDINSDPVLYRKPSTIDFRGSFKDSILSEATFRAMWDYTKESSFTDDFHLGAKKIKAENWPMGIPQVFPLKISSGIADAEARLKVEGEMINSTSKVEFADIIWDMRDIPKQGMIVELLQRVLTDVKSFSLEVGLKSSDGGLEFSVHSDLDAVVKRVLDSEIHKKLDEFQVRLKRELENRVAKLRGESEKLTAAFKSEYQGQVESTMKRLTGFQGELSNIQEQIRVRGEQAAAHKAKDLINGPTGDGLKKIKKLF